jgi:hypothetical protein
MRHSLTTILCGALVAVSTAPALAQGFNGNQYGRGSNPNLGHFYMGRQELQILDDAPNVNDMRTNPRAAAPQAAQRGPAPLPRAGFMPYSQSAMTPSMSNSLPQVVNGVPPKPVPVIQKSGINPKLGKAGVYKASKPPSRPVATTARTYAPYKGYGGGPPAGVASGPSGYGGPSSGSATRVSGSLLHWSRTGH